jgi:pimeloyl-ACP methyl ester carboxylesterase
MDFRGHGRSDVTDQPFTVKDLSDDIAALLGALKIEEAILVGHSLGGMLAMDVAARTTLACALVLLEGWTRLGAGAALEGKRFFGTLSEATIESIQAKGKAMRGRFKPGIWEAFWQTLQAFDGLPFLESASIPVIEAYGEMGRTERTFERLLIPPNPHIKVRWIPSAGHYLPIEEPVEIAALCREAADLVGDRTRRSEG